MLHLIHLILGNVHKFIDPANNSGKSPFGASGNARELFPHLAPFGPEFKRAGVRTFAGRSPARPLPMSISAMSYVWKHSGQKGGALLVLLALADFANDEGTCWPSIATLAQRARIHPRQAKRVVSGLVSCGEVVIETKGGFSPEGKNLANVYRIVPKAFGGGGKMSLRGVVTKCQGGSDMGARGGGGVDVTPIIIFNHHINKGACAPEPFGSAPKPQTEDQLKQILRELKAELAEILRPGGAAYPVEPSDAGKVERVAFLRCWIQETKAELQSRTKRRAAK